MQDFEVKYSTTNAKAQAIKAWLDLNLLPDGEFPEAIISSIYFDTKNFRYLDEKLNSDHLKSKFRIRWYKDVKTGQDSEICFFEFKHKIGFQRQKKRLKAPNKYANLSLNSSQFYNCFLELGLHHLSLPEPIFPCFTINYTRKRYIDPHSNLRVCIDSNIHVAKTNPFLISNNIKAKYLSQCVFETKGAIQQLPHRCEFFESMGLKKDSFSKYERCYQELLSKD